MNKDSAKKKIRITVIYAIVAVGIIWVCSHFIHLGNVEWTDNAQVRRNIVPINSRVQGYIERICFDDFQQVKAGDTLVVIDNSEYLLRVAQANAAYQRSLVDSTAMGTTISTTENNLSVSDAGIEELRIRLEQAERDYRRYEQLLEQKAVTRQQYEMMKVNYEAMKSKYDMLVRQKQSTRLVKTEQTQRLEQRKAEIEAAAAAHDLAKLNLSYTVITAPCDGIASRKSIQLGQLIQPGQNLLSLVESNKVWVIANYKETQTANITEGMEVEVRVDAVSDVVYKGVVAGILCGTPFTFYALARKKWRPRNVAIVGFLFFTMYQVMLYFLIDTETEFHQLWLPMWFRGVGTAILYVVLAYTLGKNIPFVYYFQALCAISFIRTGVGTPVCQSVLAHLLNVFRKESLMQLSLEMSLDNPVTRNFSALYGELQKQSMMVGLKEVFGVAAAVGIVTIICLCFSDLRGKYKAVIPKLPNLWRMVKFDKRH